MTRRFLAIAFCIISLGLSAQAQESQTMSEAERAAFRAEVRAYLLDNPEVIMEAVAVLEQRQSEQQAQGDVAMIKDNETALFNDGVSWVGGNPDGDITLVEFLDYRCGYCRQAFEEVKELVESDGNIRFVIKEFPILGEASTLSSRFAVAVLQVSGDEAYKNMHDALMVFDGEFNETSLSRLAVTFGLDAEAILEQMDSDEVTQVIAANHALARQMQISGTPTFVFGDQMLRGYVPLEAMQQVASEVRAQ